MVCGAFLVLQILEVHDDEIVRIHCGPHLTQKGHELSFMHVSEAEAAVLEDTMRILNIIVTKQVRDVITQAGGQIVSWQTEPHFVKQTWVDHTSMAPCL